MTLTSCNSIFYHPDQNIYFPPERIGMKAPQEVTFTASDGVKLKGWFFKADKTDPLGTIVQFHGNAENRTSHYVSLAWLVKEGYDFFTFDYRGYGDSEGEPSPKGTYLDGLAALGEADSLKRTSKNFVIYGQSLGGAISMRSLQDFQGKENVSLIVLDSTFMSYKTVARRVASSHWVTWIFSPFVWLLMSDSYAPKEFIPQSHTRLLVIHDKQDPVVPFANGEDIFNASTAKKDFWVLEKGYHVGVFGIQDPENRVHFLGILKSL